VKSQARLAGFLLSVPVWTALAVTFFAPLCWAVYAAFCSFDVRMRQTWVGLGNLRFVLSSPGMMRAVANTVTFTGIAFCMVAATAVLGGLAMSAVQATPRLRMLFLVAPLMNTAANGSFWIWLFSPFWGALTALWLAMGGQPLLWHSDPFLARLSVCVVLWAWCFPGNVWRVAVAAQGVPRELQEAAMLDGAGEWQRFRHITLPTIRRPLVYMVLAQLAGLLQVYEAPWLLWRGGPLGATETVAMRMVSLKDGYGPASALGLLLLCATTALGYGAWRMMRRT